MISIEKQLSVFLDNRPGTLARTCDALARGQINLVALSIVDTLDHAIVRLVVSDAKKAATILKEHGTVQERDVVLLELPNEPGVLAAIAKKLTAAGVNIEYAYCTSPTTPGSGRLVLRTNDIESTISALS